MSEKKLSHVTVVHRKPEYPDHIKFMKTYHVETEGDVNLEEVFRETYTKNHPEWEVLKVIIDEE